MTDYRRLVPFLLKWEGGWSDHPCDTGGATMKGVTLATYKDYRKLKGLPEPTAKDLKGITKKEWEDIFKTLYWDKCRASEIASQDVANILVDWYWCSGVHAIRITQRALEVSVDGVVGNATIGAINKRDPKELFKLIKSLRIEFVKNIVRSRPKQRVFLRGWINRIEALKYDSL